MVEVLGADGLCEDLLVGGVDLEGVCDALDCDVDGVLVVGGEGAVVDRGGEEFADCDGEALFGGYCRLEEG